MYVRPCPWTRTGGLWWPRAPAFWVFLSVGYAQAAVERRVLPKRMPPCGGAVWYRIRNTRKTYPKFYYMVQLYVIPAHLNIRPGIGYNLGLRDVPVYKTDKILFPWTFLPIRLSGISLHMSLVNCRIHGGWGATECQSFRRCLSREISFTEYWMFVQSELSFV